MKLKSEEYNNLNLGCGQDLKLKSENWINLDNSPLLALLERRKSLGLPEINVNSISFIQYDLDKFPYPFPDNSFDYIKAEHVIEHLSDLKTVMQEIHRIAKPNAKIYIEVPYFNCSGAFRDYTHKIFFTCQTLNYFTDRISPREGKIHYSQNLFKITKKRLNWKILKKPHIVNNIMNFFINLSPEFNERFFPWLTPIEELIVELKPIK